MSTSGDSGMEPPDLSGQLRIGRLLNVNARPKLQKLAARMAEQYGPPKARASQPTAILSSAARKLAETGGNLEALTQRERKAAIELFWIRMHGWEPGLTDVRRWLAWASLEWGSRIGVTRISMSFVRNFDPSSEATREVRDWLSARTGMISGHFGEFVRKHVLPRGITAVDQVARSLAAGDESFLHDAESDIRCEAVTRGSGFLVAIVAAFGRLCAGSELRDAEAVTKSLLGFFGEHGLSGARGSPSMRNDARIQMITGVVTWAGRTEIPNSTDIALEIALALADDPRISLTSWRGISDPIREEVEAWLTARTLENLFRVIDELQTDRQDMWQERRAFWRSYLPHIKRAYLLCAPAAVPIAERLKERYGRLKSSEKRHCGVLMQIVGPQGDKLIVLEINKNASALFWRPGTTGAPSFQDREYNRSILLQDCDDKRPHTPGWWQESFAQLIERETGIRGPEAGGWDG
jgi:hypothetical protein